MTKYIMQKPYFTNKLQDFDDRTTTSENDIVLSHKADLLQQIDDIISLIKQNVRADPRAEDGGLYVGLSGVAYGLFYASRSPHLPVELTRSCVSLAEEFLVASLEYCSKKSEERHCTGVAFLLGHLGVYAFAAVFYSKTGQSAKSDEHLEKFISLHKMCAPVDFLKCGGDELLVGRAGYLAGVLYLQQNLGKATVPQAVIQTIVSAMITSGRRTAKLLKSSSPLMYTYYNTKYLGAAHGLSGILQMLLSFPECLDSDATEDVRATSYCLLTCETANNNYPAVIDSPGSDLWHWCHGAPGVIYFLIKAQQTLKDDNFGHYTQRAGGDCLWKVGLLRKGPGICHGVAGNGYALLALYRATQDLKYLFRAHQFAQFIFTPEFGDARVPDSPYSLFEGWAGTLCYLVDLLQPGTASFPFFNVFD